MTAANHPRFRFGLRTMFVALVLVPACEWTLRCACADEVADALPSAEVKQVLAALEGHPRKMQSGSFKAREHRIYHRQGGLIDETYELFCAFDFKARKFRFDRTRTGPKFGWNAFYARTQDKSILYTSGRFVSIYRSDDEISPLIMPFDVRIVGFANSAELTENSSVDQLLNLFAASKAFVKRASPNGMYEVLWEYKSGNGCRKCAVDFERGGLAVRVEEYYRKDASAELQLTTRGEVDWETFSEADVPVACRIQRHRNGEITLRHTIDLEWTSVNQPINVDAFEYTSFGAPKGTRVLENRLGPPFIESVIGSDQPPATKALNPWSLENLLERFWLRER